MQYFCWTCCQLGFALDNLATEASFLPQGFDWDAPLATFAKLRAVSSAVAPTCPPPQDGSPLNSWYPAAGLVLVVATGAGVVAGLLWAATRSC